MKCQISHSDKFTVAQSKFAKTLFLIFHEKSDFDEICQFFITCKHTFGDWFEAQLHSMFPSEIKV
jgi:hypothetical protein